MTPENAHHAISSEETAHSEFSLLYEKVRFLSHPSSYGPQAAERITIKETHMSWVFLIGDTVFKLKKPVRHSYLDFRTLDARERSCRDEVRLNARLAPGVYRGVVPLKRNSAGALALRGDGEVVDWLVEMKRLPEGSMLDVRLLAGQVRHADVLRLAEVLAAFYRDADRPAVDPHMPLQHFERELAEDRLVLVNSGLLPDPREASLLLDRIEGILRQIGDVLHARASSGHIVDGHGDLRPEHVCLTEPVVIFDCLEFNRDLRLLDPFDELSFLSMECARLNAAWFGPALMKRVSDLLGEPIPHRLIMVYSALHATLRARLSLAHLLDPSPREPEKWRPLADEYLVLARDALSSLQRK